MFKIVNDSNYLAKVVQLKEFRKHENADKLLVWNVNNYEVITDLNYEIGDTVVFFPVESVINPDLLRWLNMFEKKELNRDEVKGYVHHSGRVRAIKLRGIVSEGIVIKFDKFAEWLVTRGYTAKPEFVNFDYFDKLWICKKYTPVIKTASTGNNGKTPKTIDVLVDGQFAFHGKTEKLQDNLHKITPSDIINVSVKLHGCLPGFQKITMYDGSVKKIQDIQIGDVVLGFDHTLNICCPSKVLNTFINGKTKEWVRVQKTSDVLKNGKTKKYLVLTKNHKIFIEGKGYLSFEDYSIGDNIITNLYDLEIDPIRKSILTGILLGDGYIDRSNKCWSIAWGHKESHYEYMQFITSILGNVSTGNYRKRTSGYGTKMIDSKTKHCYTLNIEFEDWIKNNKKVIPENLVLDDYSLAFWYMDDGSISSTEFQKDRANFAICGFSDNDCLYLKKALLSYGFSNFTFYKDANGYNRLRLNASDAEMLFKNISRYIPECMQYKLPEEYRKKFHNYILPDAPSIIFPKKGTITNIEVISSKNIGNFSKKYDIQTETSNFFAGDILVHNSSAVYSNVLIKRKLSLLEKLASKVFNIVKEEYSKMYSSRTVLKYIEKVFKKDGGFYATDFWGTVYNDIKDSIEEGYSIYGEIVGNLNGSYVQKGYDYSLILKDNTYGFFVYKITYTTPKGTVIELSWQQMQEYCKKHNLNLVPTVYFGNASGHVPFYQDTVEEWQESFIKHLRANIEVKCHYCTNDVPFEGYVVRKENANPLRLKIKSKNFLAYETKQLDAGEQDTEEGN